MGRQQNDRAGLGAQRIQCGCVRYGAGIRQAKVGRVDLFEPGVVFGAGDREGDERQSTCRQPDRIYRNAVAGGGDPLVVAGKLVPVCKLPVVTRVKSEVLERSGDLRGGGVASAARDRTSDASRARDRCAGSEERRRLRAGRPCRDCFNWPGEMRRSSSPAKG